MIKFMRSAVVVVACLFAGSGAWADTFRQTAGDAPTYAAELFGSDDEKITYPTCAVVPGGATCTPDDANTADVNESASASETNSPWARLTYRGEEVGADANAKGMITFTLSAGAFASHVGANDLMIGVGVDDTGSANTNTPARVTSVSDGRAGDSSVTFEVTGALTQGNTFTWVLPRLDSLGALATSRAITVATSTVATGGTGFPHNSIELFCPSAAVEAAAADTDSLITGTVAEDGTLTARIGDTEAIEAALAGATNTCDVKANPAADTSSARIVVKSADTVKLTKTSMDAKEDSSVRINLDDRSMLVANSRALSQAPNPYNPNTFHVGENAAAQLASLTLAVASAASDGATILQLDGTPVDFALAGTLGVSVTGSNDLFGEDDTVFVNWNDPARWNQPRAVDKNEALNATESGNRLANERLSIDPDDRATRTIGVYYIPGGKNDLMHGTTLQLAATVHYNRSYAIDESPVRSTTELRFHGVAGALQAYALPHSANSRMDRANLRIRCEEGDGFSMGAECRAFLECWDEHGTPGFGELMGGIGENTVRRVDAEEIEETIDMMDASSRLSCRVLATGDPSVQTLVRTNGTLVNNSYVTND